MAYSAILIPHLEKEDAEMHATKEETSWISKIASNNYITSCRIVYALQSRD